MNISLISIPDVTNERYHGKATQSMFDVQLILFLSVRAQVYHQMFLMRNDWQIKHFFYLRNKKGQVVFYCVIIPQVSLNN